MKNAHARTTGSGPDMGRTVVEKTARLLHDMRFSTSRGAFAEGQGVAVGIDPRWNDDRESISVLITCRACGHQQVNWSGLAIAVDDEVDRTRPAQICSLDAHGQTVIPRLRPGRFRVTARLTEKEGARGVSALEASTRRPSVFEPERERLAAAPALSDEEFAAQTTEPGRRVWRQTSDDGRLVWTAESTEYGDLQVAFETSERNLARHCVSFSLLDPDTGAVRYARILVLEPARTSGKWEGWCSLPADLRNKGPFELRHELLPPGST